MNGVTITFGKILKENVYINFKFLNGDEINHIDIKNVKYNDLRKIICKMDIKLCNPNKNILIETLNKTLGDKIDEILNKYTKNIGEKIIIPIEKNIKGKNSSINGKLYEEKVFNVVNKCKYNDMLYFNTQDVKQLGGCSDKNDLLCNWNNELENIAIEIKKSKAPDWCQCGLIFDNKNQEWIINPKSNINEKCRNIFIRILKEKNVKIFNNKIPPFFSKKMTYDEWINLKSNNKDFDDIYLSCSDDTISELYYAKGCKYIQISEKGLYYLKEDYCNFNVPKFICEQRVRIRVKVHSRGRAGEICNLSVTMSCQPKNIRLLENSLFSLDDGNKIPLNLKYN